MLFECEHCKQLTIVTKPTTSAKIVTGILSCASCGAQLIEKQVEEVEEEVFSEYFYDSREIGYPICSPYSEWSRTPFKANKAIEEIEDKDNEDYWQMRYARKNKDAGLLKERLDRMEKQRNRAFRWQRFFLTYIVMGFLDNVFGFVDVIFEFVKGLF